MTAQFVKERPLPVEGSSGAFEAGRMTEARVKAPVTVEDAAFFLAQFDNGVLGSFEATRFAPGRKNYNTFEIYGSKGSITFNLERMNELNFFSSDDPECAQGFRNIMLVSVGVKTTRSFSRATILSRLNLDRSQEGIARAFQS